MIAPGGFRPPPDLRIPGSEVGAVAGGEPDAILVAPGEDAEAVMLDLVNPAGTGRRLLGRARQAWFEGDAVMQHAGTEKRSMEARSSAIHRPMTKPFSGRRVVAAGR